MMFLHFVPVHQARQSTGKTAKAARDSPLSLCLVVAVTGLKSSTTVKPDFLSWNSPWRPCKQVAAQ
jgi:hypothetical protein